MVSPATTEVTTGTQAFEDVSTPVAEPVVPEATPPVKSDQPPVTTPTQPIPPAFTPQDEYLRQRAALADQYERQAQEKALEDQLIAEAQSIQREAELNNVDPEYAKKLAQKYYDKAKFFSQEQQKVLAQQQLLVGKTNASLHFGRKYGVNPQMLMIANDDKEMEAIAQREQRYQQLEMQVKQLQQNIVKPQTFDTATGRAGGVSVTRENADELYVDGKIDGATYKKVKGW